MRHGERTTDPSHEPLRLADGVDPTSLDLDAEAGFLLSRIDGQTSWPALRQIAGLPPDRVDRYVERWMRQGILIDPEPRAREAPPGATPAASPEAAAPTELSPDREALLDPALELPVELQRRVLRLEELLQAPYHEILGVSTDADRRVLKRAYFRLAKDLHPDRYFRRDIGSYAARLDRVYKRIVEAYELLSDPTARAEIERSLAAAAGQAPAARAPDSRSETRPTPQAIPESPTAPPARRRVPLRPRLHGFSLHNRVMRERRAKAKRFFEGGMAAFAKEQWIEAAGSVRLAVAFDPWNEAYRERFAEVQRKAGEILAERAIKEAEAALDLRDYPAALRAFEDALQYRSHDADLLQRAAHIALLTGHDLHQAKEWAQAAVEIEPERGAYHRVLGQIFKAAGLEANARREFETALRLDPGDDETRAELSSGGRLRAPRWLGGKG